MFVWKIVASYIHHITCYRWLVGFPNMTGFLEAARPQGEGSHLAILKGCWKTKRTFWGFSVFFSPRFCYFCYFWVPGELLWVSSMIDGINVSKTACFEWWVVEAIGSTWRLLEFSSEGALEKLPPPTRLWGDTRILGRWEIHLRRRIWICSLREHVFRPRGIQGYLWWCVMPSNKETDHHHHHQHQHRLFSLMFINRSRVADGCGSSWSFGRGYWQHNSCFMSCQSTKRLRARPEVKGDEHRQWEHWSYLLLESVGSIKRPHV